MKTLDQVGITCLILWLEINCRQDIFTSLLQAEQFALAMRACLVLCSNTNRGCYYVVGREIGIVGPELYWTSV